MIHQPPKVNNPFIKDYKEPEGKFNQAWVNKTHKMSKFLSLSVIFISLIIIGGWIFNIPFFQGAIGSLVPTRLNTAFLFLIMGTLAYLLNKNSSNEKIRLLGSITGILILIFGFITIMEYVLGIFLPLDNVLLASQPEAITRPRFLSSINILLFGIIILLFSRPMEIAKGQILCVTTGLISYLGLLTFLIGLGNSSNIFIYNQMAPLSSFLHLALSLSFIGIFPKEGIMKIFHQEAYGGYMSRYLIPASVIIISVTGLFIVVLEQLKIFTEQFGLVLLIIFTLAFTFFLILRYANRINRFHMARVASENRIIKMEKFFEDIIEGIVDGILVTDSSNKIIYLNQGMKEIFQVESGDLLNKNFLKDPSILNFINIEENYLQVVKNLKPAFVNSLKVTNTRDNVFVSGWIIPQIENGKFNGAILTTSDVTAVKEAETVLEASLKEKELFLAEIHHRVKNNMQIISSLLRLQSSRLDDETVQNILTDSQNRIKSMAMVHESLYLSENFASINMFHYINKLIRGLQSTYQMGAYLEFEVESEEIELEIEMAIPVGLIINELVTNSIKHGFSPDKNGKITVHFKRAGLEYELIVKDNGVGFDQDLNFKDSPSLGMELVHALTDQLDGVLKFNGDNGTCVNIQFKNIYYSPRY